MTFVVSLLNYVENNKLLSGNTEFSYFIFFSPLIYYSIIDVLVNRGYLCAFHCFRLTISFISSLKMDIETVAGEEVVKLKRKKERCTKIYTNLK